MAFQGAVAQIPLSNILQALLLNSQEGILTLEVGSSRRKVRVLKQGLRLLNYFQDTPDLLKQILVKQRLLTESQFQNIFSTWTPGSCFPGDFLVSRRILTKEAVSSDILRQLENIILDLIVAPGLKYEFTADADGTPYELFDPAGLGAELVMSSNAVLMEAVRRDDEWRRIHEAIPSASEIFIVPDRAALSTKGLEVDPRCLKELKPLLNGENSVERLIELTTLSSFEVHETLFQLRKKGISRPLDLEEKKSLAEKFRKSLRADDAVHILRSILSSEPGDQQARLRLISILEKKKDAAQELSGHYLHLASQLAGTERGQAKTYLEKVLVIAPHDLAALELLFDVQAAEGDHREALATARAVVAAAKAHPDESKAGDLLYKIINFYPEETVLFHELAEIHLQSRDVDAAVTCLKSVAEIYERRRDLSRLRKTYEQIIRLKPSEAPRLKRLADIERSARASGPSTLKLGAVSLLVLAAATALVFLGITEFEARAAYSEILKDVESQKSSGDLIRARANLEQFAKTFPYSTCIRAARDELSEVNRLFRKKREEEAAELERRRVFAESSYTKIRMAVDADDYAKASDLLAQLDASALSAEHAREVRGIQENLDGYFSKAAALLSEARAAEEREDYPRSHLLQRGILTNYPSSRAALEVLLPVRIESSPPGSDLFLEGQLAGQTPLLLRLPPRKMPTLVVSRKGYRPWNLLKEPIDGKYFSPLDSHVVKIHLLKSSEWQISAGAPIEGFPAVWGENVCFGTRGGRISCVKQDSGEAVWTFTVPENMDFAGGIGVWNNLLYFGSYDGRIYVLEASTGRLARDPFPASPDLWPIKQAPSAASESGLIAVNCDRKLIATYNVATGKPGWSIPFPSSPVLGQPQACQGSLYLATQKGEVLAVDSESGTIQRRMPLGFELTVRGRVSGGRYFAGSAQGKLICLDPAAQRILWSYECGSPIVSPPTVDGDWVVVPTASGKLHCVTTAGELKWVLDAQDVILPETEGVALRNHFLIGTRRGLVLCLDLWSGNLIWSFRTAGSLEKDPRGILSSGAVSRGKFFVGSEDHSMYCFSLE